MSLKFFLEIVIAATHEYRALVIDASSLSGVPFRLECLSLLNYVPGVKTNLCLHV